MSHDAAVPTSAYMPNPRVWEVERADDGVIATHYLRDGDELSGYIQTFHEYIVRVVGITRDVDGVTEQYNIRPLVRRLSRAQLARLCMYPANVDTTAVKPAREEFLSVEAAKAALEAFHLYD